MKKYIILINLLIIFSNIKLHSQLQISQNLTPTQLIQQVLIGNGVTVSNITFTGDVQAIGKFYNGATTNVGLQSGVIMTTGSALNAIGPNNSNNKSTNNSGGSDPQLANLVTTTINDAAVFEFDFIPIADTVSFRYVFGSEEYEEYVNSNYNDVFGFFISGPNPAGGTYNNVNMAMIPGTNNPVSINNVNQGMNTAYYFNNDNGITIQYDGMTVVLEAWAVVTPCVTYHFKAAIGDAGDGALDSGVFLEEGSFSTNAVQISTNYTIQGAIQKGIEGCNSAEIKVTLPKILPQDYAVLIDTMWGTATNGIDFPHIADSIIVPAGQLEGFLTLTPLADGINEGQEEWNMIFQTSSCTVDTVTIPMIDYTPIEFSKHQADTMVCSDSLVLSVYPIYGILPYEISWSPNSDLTDTNLASTWANPGQTTNFIIEVKDISGCPSVWDTINVEVNPKVYVSFISNKYSGCEPLEVNFTDLSTPNITEWKWYFGDGDSSSVKDPTHIFSAGVYNITLKAKASSGCFNEFTANNLINSFPKPVADFYLEPSVVTIKKPTINFINTSTDGDTWLWNFGDNGSNNNTATTQDASHAYSDVGNFVVWLIATSDKGCIDSTYYTATVIVDEIKVPNVITPNGDGSNDFFVIENIERLESSYLRIYNRWGKIVFSSKNYKNDWNAEGLSDGVYFWQIDYKTFFREATEKGTVTVLRK
jgi:gliding motility-associated-like protein